MSGIFVINGFYASMRDVYCKADAKIHWYDVEWESADSSWEDFRGKTLGATDPVTAVPGALRRIIFDTYESLGLSSEPNVGDNGVHASASPFEALAERLNWLGAKLADDSFGQALLAAGLDEKTIMAWTKDPQVELKSGGTGSLFDQVEDQSVEECVATLQALAGVEGKVGAMKNRAYLFVKPAANTDATNKLVAEKLGEAKITILADGVLTGPEIEENKYIDNHYLSIAVKASLNKPAALNPPAAGLKKFEGVFGMTWAAVLEENRMFNAVDACKMLGVDGDQLNTLWAAAKKNGKLAKLSGGFYAGLLPCLSLPALTVCDQKIDLSAPGFEAVSADTLFTSAAHAKLLDMNGEKIPFTTSTVNGVELKQYPAVSCKFLLNGFYAGMRNKFCAQDARIHWYDVEWDTKANSWEDFRGAVLGATDPATAAPGALRRIVFDTWESLGLKSEPNVGDNGVHASASPFEALAERMNWLGASVADDSFGQALLAAGIPEATIVAWTKDPQVELKNGGTGSLFDQVEDQSFSECVATLQSLAGVEGPVSGSTNRAYLFIKPHAVTDGTVKLVTDKLAEAKITILADGEMTGTEISDNMYIDNHYLSIATKASLNKPAQLNPPAKGAAAFYEKFGISWVNALSLNCLFNAVDGQAELGFTADTVDTEWAACKKNKHLVKLSGGFYAGRILKIDA